MTCSWLVWQQWCWPASTRKYIHLRAMNLYISVTIGKQSVLRWTTISLLFFSFFVQLYSWSSVSNGNYHADSTKLWSDSGYTQGTHLLLSSVCLLTARPQQQVFLRRFLRATRSLMDTRETLSMVNLTSSVNKKITNKQTNRCDWMVFFLQYICELSLLSVDFLRFPPSLRALCALIIALDTQKVPVWVRRA